MKRKLTALFLTLMLLAGLPSRALAAEAPEQTQAENTVSIFTPEDWAAFAQNCVLDTWSVDKHVVLRADISLEEVDAATVATFGGSFDGGGHTISGLHITRNLAPAGLFGILQSTAQVKNLSVQGRVVPGGAGTDAGGIVGENYGQLENCRFSGEVVGQRNTGGIAGSNYGTLTGCAAEGTLTGSNRTGGIAGYNNGKLVSCRNAMAVNTQSVDPKLDPTKIDLNFNLDFSKKADLDASDAATDTGGITGYSSGSISACTNTGTVGYPHIGYNLGGIAGRNSGFIADCENSGEVMGRKDVGGVVGQIEPHVQTLLSPDYLETLSKQFENLGGLVSKAGSHGAESGGNIQGSIQSLSSYQSTAQGAISDLAEAAKNEQLNEGALETLGSAVHGMAGAAGSLERSIGAGVETLTGDINAISGQINSISRTLAMATEDAKQETVTDISTVDLDLITDGRVLNCTNTGSVQADLNVGGVTGVMGLESTADPEDDAPGGSLTQRRRYELKAIIDGCESTGTVTGKRSYVGAVCGRMELGLITQSRGYGRISSEDGDYVGGIAGLGSGTIRGCFAKCTLTGNNYIGGIVGSGIGQDYSGDASTVSDCYSMVDIPEYKQFAGAISGANIGIFANNYFVSDTLAGINQVSYGSVAQPITYEQMQRSQELPQSLRELTLRFVADGKTVKSLSFHYGDSFDDSVFPEIPQKEGCYAKWDIRELTNLRFDTVVSADYLPYITSLSSESLRFDNRPVFFVQGQFQERDGLRAERSKAEAFHKDRLTLQEQWTLSIPADGLESHTIRYLPEQESTQLYLLKNGSWTKISPETMGSYLVFAAAGAQVELAAATPVSSERDNLLIAAAALAAIALLVLCTLLRKKSRKKTSDTEQKPKKRGRKRMILSVILLAAALVLVILASFYFREPVEDLGQKVRLYDILKSYLDEDDRQMKLTVQAQIEDRNADFTAQIASAKVGGKDVSVIRENERCLYYAQGVVYLENGSAFRLNSAAPDYSQLTIQLLQLCQSAQVEPADGVYTITVDGEQATALAKLLLPRVQELLPDTGSMTVDLITQAGRLTQIRFTGAGNLTDSVKTPFSVSAAVDVLPAAKTEIPSPVSLAILSGDAKPQDIYSDELIGLIDAWNQLRKTNHMGAQVTVGADLGTLSVDEDFQYYAWKVDNTVIHGVREDEKTVYFTEKAACNEEGRTVGNRLAVETDMASLMNALYETVQGARFQCRQENGTSVYTVDLTASAMEQLTRSILPKTKDLKISYDKGSIRLCLNRGQFQSVQISCGGSTKLALVTADAKLTMDIRMDSGSPIPALPEAVKAALVNKEK